MNGWSEAEWYKKVNAWRVAHGVKPLDLDALARLATIALRTRSAPGDDSPADNGTTPAEMHPVGSATQWTGGMVRKLPTADEQARGAVGEE